MTDQEMFEVMAKLWIALGGDAMGFQYSISAIHDRIIDIEIDKCLLGLEQTKAGVEEQIKQTKEARNANPST